MNTLIATNKAFGPPEVLEFQEKSCPTLGPKEFLVKGQFATVSTADIRLRSKNVPLGFGFIMSLMFGFRKPKYESLGTDYAGQVAQIGPAVKDIQVGDRVVVDCGMRLNGYRTYRVIKPKETWVKIPDSVPSDLAVSGVFGGLTAFLFLVNKLKIRPNDRVLIIGAGGAVGSSAVQLARHFGAEVIGVCSAGKSEIVRNLGASQVLDYNTKDWHQKALDMDVILDCVGVLDISSARKHLKPNGRVGFIVADLMLNFKCLISSMFGSHKFIAGAIQSTKDDLGLLMDLMVQGKFKPLIGKRYSFSNLVDAHHEVERGHRLGSTLLEY